MDRDMTNALDRTTVPPHHRTPYAHPYAPIKTGGGAWAGGGGAAKRDKLTEWKAD